MKQYGLVYVTVKNLETARKIARVCLEKKLVACANIFPAILSCYEWKDKYTEEKERVLILKTREDLFENLRKVIIKYHSYTCPCVVFIPIVKAHLPFLSWMERALQTSSLKRQDRA